MKASPPAFLSACILLAMAWPAGPVGADTTHGWLEREGVFTCWDADAPWDRTCEISGAIRTRRGLVVATDKPLGGVAGVSHVWRTRLPGAGATPRLAEYAAPALRGSTKIEGLAVEADGDWCFATTSFSWFVPGEPERADAWNCLVAWRESVPGSAHVVEPTVRSGVTSSVSLLPRLRAALASPTHPAGPAWFKIEGLAVLPGRRLAFGVRAVGPSHREPTMVGIVLASRYAVCGGRVRLVGPLDKIVEWDPGAVVGRPAGVSGLTYDTTARRLLVLTSYEAAPASRPEDLDGWVWVLSHDALHRGCPPALVRDGTGAPLRFGHKPEAIAQAGRNRYLVIHDDDRVLGPPDDDGAHATLPRTRNQARYAYLRLGSPR